VYVCVFSVLRPLEREREREREFCAQSRAGHVTCSDDSFSVSLPPSLSHAHPLMYRYSSRGADGRSQILPQQKHEANDVGPPKSFAEARGRGNAGRWRRRRSGRTCLRAGRRGVHGGRARRTRLGCRSDSSGSWETGRCTRTRYTRGCVGSRQRCSSNGFASDFGNAPEWCSYTRDGDGGRGRQKLWRCASGRECGGVYGI